MAQAYGLDVEAEMAGASRDGGMAERGYDNPVKRGLLMAHVDAQLGGASQHPRA